MSFDLPIDKSFSFYCASVLGIGKCNLYAQTAFVCSDHMERHLFAQFSCANYFWGCGLETQNMKTDWLKLKMIILKEEQVHTSLPHFIS